jgi:type I restriction-modification system DNA methylase subunit
MKNERITEDIVRQHFKNDPLFSSVKFEEQKSTSATIRELLKGESKSKGKGSGYPEFIVTFPSNSNYLMVVECKAEAAKHASKELNKPTDFAVDGVLHYAKALSKQYDVIAIAVSGQTETELEISHFFWKKSAKDYEPLTDKKLLQVNDYSKLFAGKQFADSLIYNNIILKAIALNEEYNNYSIPEQDRNTMVNAILLALLSDSFRDGYKSQSTIKGLYGFIINEITAKLTEAKVKNVEAMLGEFNKLSGQPLFNQDVIANKKDKLNKKSLEVLKEMIRYLDTNVYPLTQMEDSGFDVLGQFYTEFIRYAGSQQKQGLVLTPFHVTDLFCDLVQLNVNDVLYDPCCGTAGFLVSGMKNLLELAGNDTKKKDNIKRNQLVGVEMRPSMYTYACTNMLFRGDGKSNIFCGDCFQKTAEVKSHKPTVAFLNPPYDVGTAKQMEFIEHALDIVAPQNGRVAAIVQMSCGIKNEKELIAVKKRLLDKYHLKAVLSMPDDLFYPVGVVTCVMVFDASKPNKDLKTWFGYFKDDGFEKRKHQGRIDARGRYETIKEKWLNAYKNVDEIEGLSVRQEVTAGDEWCAEAYMETDYSTLCDDDFIKKIKDYTAFLVQNERM